MQPSGLGNITAVIVIAFVYCKMLCAHLLGIVVSEPYRILFFSNRTSVIVVFAFQNLVMEG